MTQNPSPQSLPQSSDSDAQPGAAGGSQGGPLQSPLKPLMWLMIPLLALVAYGFVSGG